MFPRTGNSNFHFESEELNLATWASLLLFVLAMASLLLLPFFSCTTQQMPQ